MDSRIVLTINGNVSDLLTSSASISVYEKAGQATEFQLRLPIDIVDSDFPMLLENDLAPGNEVMILAYSNDVSECLVKGQIFGHEVQYLHGGVGSSVRVFGGDSRFTMQRENKCVQWADVTDSEVVSSIVAQYGMIPEVSSTDSRHLTEKHSLIQRNTDDYFIDMLAKRNGFLFWVGADDSGIETAYFQPPQLQGNAHFDLVINMDEANLDEFTLKWDCLRATEFSANQLDLNSLELIEANASEADLEFLGNTMLSQVINQQANFHSLAPANDTGCLTSLSKGMLNDSQWFIHGKCVTSANRLGRILRANKLANIRGLGSRHSGYYYISSVTHTIDSTRHLMNVEVVRNAWS